MALLSNNKPKGGISFRPSESSWGKQIPVVHTKHCFDLALSESSSAWLDEGSIRPEQFGKSHWWVQYLVLVFSRWAWSNFEHDWCITLWLKKSIGKYHEGWWWSRGKILDFLPRSRRLRGKNPIFFRGITINPEWYFPILFFRQRVITIIFCEWCFIY